MPSHSGRFRAVSASVVGAMILAGCTKELTGPRIANLVIVSGSGQQGAAGANLSQPFQIRAEDQSGQPAVGILITWKVTAGGGTISPAQSTTDQAGEATATLRLGSTIGLNSVTASIDNSTVVTFSANATTAPAARLAAASGNAQTGTVGSQLPQNLVVQVTDELDNPTAGVTVTFTVASGGGSLSAATAVTDAFGNASVRWTLGNVLGIQTVLATAPGVPALTLTATAQAAAASALVLTSGNLQTGAPGATLPLPLRVQAQDPFGNPVSGVTVVWTASPGGGSLNPASSVTDATGFAQTSWTLGGVGGPSSVTATSGSLNVTFNGGVAVTYASVSAGGRSTCAITVDHVMLCWGYNGEGQLALGQPPLGSGPVFAYPQPTAATGNLTFRHTEVDLYHGCAITLAGVGYCWGVNHDGRLGTNTVIPSSFPIQILTSLSFRMMGVSRNHTCGLSLSDRIYCWGYAGDGQIGDGVMFPPAIARDSVLFPVEVGGNPALRFQALAAGGQHTCAITTPVQGRAAYCWGFNGSGQLGDGTLTRDSVPTAVLGGLILMDVPAPVAGQPVQLTIAAGYNHSCALDAGGAAHCWGSNAKGQLGRAGGGSTVPVAVAGGLTFSSITAGESHSCAVATGGGIYCWGSNERGQLGDPATSAGTGTMSPVPVLIATPAGLGFVAVSAGDQHTCAVTATNLVYCWGDNQYGQLGDGTRDGDTPDITYRRTPIKVAFQP